MYCQFCTIILFSIVLSMHSALEHNYALVNNALYQCCINSPIIKDYDHNFLLKCD